MNNFNFCNPVNIVFGKNTISQLANLIPSDTKVMLCYGGGSIRKNGVYDQVISALSGKEHIEFSGIEPNPLFETCMQAVDIIKEENIGFLLGVGGGSVIDAVKFIAAASKCEGSAPWEILVNHGTNVSEAMPFGCVLTMPATGTEMNANSVISRKSSDEKLAFASSAVYPTFSILDPETTYSIPKNQLRNGIVDAFVHVVEQYITYDIETPLQDRQAEAILNTLVELADRVLAQNKDYNALAGYMWCTTQALNGTIACGAVGDWSTHMIGHELTAFWGLAHAESLAVVLPGVWKHQFENKKEKLAKFGERVWNLNHDTNDENAVLAIERTVEFFHSVGMPTSLADYNICKDDIAKVSDRFKQRNTIVGEHQNIGHKEVGEILTLCL